MSATLDEPATYRQSLIAAFDSCALRARFAMEDPRRTPGPLAARGTLLHRFVHKAAKEMWTHGERRFGVDQGMELLTDVLCQHDVPSEDTVPITMRELVWARIVATKWCEYTHLDARRMLEAEKRFYAPLTLPTGEVVYVTGQLDLLLADPPDGVVVVDYKAGFRRPKDLRIGDEEQQARADAEGRGLTELGWVQNLIYSYLCFENIPSISRVIFKEVHVLWKTERHAKTERWQMERLKDVLAAQVARLHRGVQEGPGSAIWTPSAGAHCALCAKPRACPIREHVGIPATYREAQTLAQEWVVAGEIRKERRSLLDGWVEAYGPIEVPHADGRRVVGWDYHPDGKRNFKIFEPRGVPESPYDDVLAEAAREAGVLREG